MQQYSFKHDVVGREHGSCPGEPALTMVQGPGHSGGSSSFRCQERPTDRHALDARNAGGSELPERKTAPSRRNCFLHDLVGGSGGVALGAAASGRAHTANGIESAKAPAVPSSRSELTANVKCHNSGVIKAQETCRVG